MNLKKMLAGLCAIGAAVGIAIAHNIDAIIKQPSVIGSVILATIGSYVLGHDHGTPTPPTTTP